MALKQLSSHGFVFVFGLSLCFIGNVVAIVCGDGNYVGDDLIARGGVDFQSARFWLLQDTTPTGKSVGEIGCYGVVKYFEIFCRASGVVTFQVWRGGGGGHQLLGEQTVTIDCTAGPGIIRTNLADNAYPWNRIPVRPGDLIGFRQDDFNSVVAMDTTGLPCCNVGYDNPPISPALGASHTFGTFATRRFSLRAVVAPGYTPVFVNIPNTVAVKENIPAGTFVYNAQATDEDLKNHWYAGGGDQLLYFLNDPQFTIDSTTGVITTTANLDFETASTHLLEVVVRDGGDTVALDGLSATATLTVNVRDVNEEHITFNLPTTISRSGVYSPAGTEVFQVLVSDNETSDSLRYILESTSPDDGMFTLTSDGRVVTAKDLFETTANSYDLTISVVDDTYVLGPEVLTIQVFEHNLSPVLHNLPETVDVPEDQLSGTEVFRVQATDVDGDVLTYKVDSYNPYYSDTIFSLDRTTGYVTMIYNPGFDGDAGGVNTYELDIHVKDSLYQTTTERLTINIVNINEPPEFTTEYYEVYIPEKQAIGTLLPFSFVVMDPDGALDTQTYDVIAGSGSTFFGVAGDQLQIDQVIDLGTQFEHRSFILTVRVTDSGGLTDRATVNVTVYNVNEDHFFTNLEASITIDAQLTFEGDELFTVEVAPVEPFDVFTFSTPISPNDGSFRLDPRTGVVTAGQDLRDIAPGAYVLNITCFDRVGEQVGPEELFINVINLKRPPVIVNLPRTVSLAETLDLQMDVFQVVASDSDGDPILSYTLTSVTPTSGEDKFVFDRNTGLLTTIPHPNFDHETVPSYQLSFTARDYLYTSPAKTLTVLITDVNEPPVFNVDYYTVTIDEETAIGTILSLLPQNFAVTDPDSPEAVTYLLALGPHSTYFATQTPDRLRVSQRIDVDEGQTREMNLEVIAVDSGGLRDKAYVTVYINDINDNAPIFDQSYYSATIPENTFGGTSILTVHADDKDSGEFGRVEYSIRYSWLNDSSYVGDLYFEVDKDTGLVSVAHHANFEEHDVVNFEIVARDMGSPFYYYNIANVTITITDVNDITPVFVKEFFNLETPQHTPVDTLMATLLAVDIDTGERGDMIYFDLMDENKHYFAVGPDSGEVRVEQPLESDVSYVLYCFARDQGRPGYEISTSAIVRVDSFSDWKFLIDIHLSISRTEYEDGAQEFHSALSEILEPWVVKIYKVRGKGEKLKFARRRLLHAFGEGEDGETIVTVYALEDNLSDSVDNIEVPKSFVWRDKMLEKLRDDIVGHPKDELKSGNMSAFGVIKVTPSYPVWAIDSVAGIATMATCAFVLLMIGVGVSVCCCYRYRVCCFSGCRKRPEQVKLDRPNNQIPPRQPTPTPAPPAPAPLPPVEREKPRHDSEDFKLGYKSYGNDGKVQFLDKEQAKGLNFDKVNDKKMINTTSTVLVPMVVSKRWSKKALGRPDSSDTIHSKIYSKKVNNTDFSAANPNIYGSERNQLRD